jgi:probable addiction module antidote protein
MPISGVRENILLNSKEGRKGETEMKKKITSTNHDDFVVEQLKKDERFLEAYLNEALSDENEDPRVILDMLLKVAQASGGVRRLAQTANLNRQNLYKIFSAEKGNPEFFTINKIVNALGFHFKLVRNKRRMAIAK